MSETSRLPLKCPSNFWGYALRATGTLEVRCRGKYCRTADGGAVIHAFDQATGSFVTRVETIQQAVRPQESTHARNTAV